MLRWSEIRHGVVIIDEFRIQKWSGLRLLRLVCGWDRGLIIIAPVGNSTAEKQYAVAVDNMEFFTVSVEGRQNVSIFFISELRDEHLRELIR